MSWFDWIGLVSAIVSCIGAILVGVKWLHRMVVEAVVEGVAEELQPIHTEMNPNHGSSMKDRVVKVELRLDEIDSHLGTQDRRLDAIWNALIKK